MNMTWAITKPYNNSERSLVCYVCGITKKEAKMNAEKLANELNEKEHTNIYLAEIVERFDTRDSFGVR